jgi:superfamily II DNA or RNA helicase/ubiquinone/menaquinone biosynthesis C-methylase UbiE
METENLERELRLYQVEAAKDIRDNKRVIIADDMGLGKCAEAIIAKTALEKKQGHDEKALIVCPPSVAQHWSEEIKCWYKKKGETRITTIQTPTYDSDLQKIERENSDFAIIGYSTLSSFGADRSSFDKLRRLNFQYGIVDEVHNAKNPDSIRSMAVKKLFDSMDYLALLSGTPIPNSVIDIYMLLSLLDKDRFPITQTSSRAILAGFYNLFRRDPEAISELINSRMIRRTAENYLEIPKLKQQDVEIKLEGEHAEVYKQIYENPNIRPGAKLMQLIKASIDPNLVNPHFLDSNLALNIGNMKSCVYNSLDKLVQQVTDKNGKILIFSNLKVGVVDKLQERYKQYGAEVIDSEVTSISYETNISRREEIRRKFQKDSDCKILIATTVMNEGVDLTGATDIVHLTLPYTPAEFDQRNRRSQRIGEIRKEEVNVHVISPILDSVPIIIEGIKNLLADKRRIINFMMNDPVKVTYQDLKEFRDGNSAKSKHLRFFLNTPAEIITRHLGSMHHMGWVKIKDYYKNNPNEASDIARLYASYWEGYYSGNTATLYGKLIELLEKNGKLVNKLDIASGPFSLSRKIKEPVTNIDINEYMLQAGKLLAKRGEIVAGNKSVCGAFHELPFDKESFDLALCSLALHTSKLNLRHKKGIVNERELAIREANRVLRTGAYYLITLPKTRIVEKDLPIFNLGLEKLGFDVMPFSGFYKSKQNSSFKVYLGAFKKRAEPCSEPLDEDALKLEMDKEPQRIKRSSAKEKKHPASVKEPKIIQRESLTEFYQAETQMTLEELMDENVGS